MVEVVFEDRHYRDATLKGEAERARAPIPASARFDEASCRIVLDFTIAGLMNGIFGTAKFMDAQRRGGQSRSAVKVEASRVNGAKGGQPRKIS